MKIIKLSQSYSDSYFSGNVPDLSGNIGTSMVDVSSIASQFPNAHKSVALVNKYDSSLLINIGYIFDFDNQSAYGVYLPGLTTEMNFIELKNELEDIGYVVVNENGKFVAYPEDEEKQISEEEIRAEIERHYDPIKNRGGTVFGVNINKILNDVENSFNNIKEHVDESLHENLKSDLKIAFVASVMAHEAVHAKQDLRSGFDQGAPSQGEGPSEQVERDLLSKVLKQIYPKYGLDPSGLVLSSKNISGFVKTSENSNNWYKKAKAYPFYPPSGSDLKGRIGRDGESYQGQPDWGMLNHQYSNRAIEEMLGNFYNSPIPKDLSQEHDIYELQLRKYTRDDYKLDSELIFDELLRKDHVGENIGYKHIEELLEDERPQPLLKTIKKKASKIIKEATLFGWYNNLEISDGSTIPGLGDRVMEWDDRDEDFSEEEYWIKSQPRYNPTYDIKGFYYRWVEPRFRPELWNSYNRDVSNIHPARRFAQKNNKLDDINFVINVLRKIKSSLSKNKYKASRLICSEDLLDIINKFSNSFNISIFDVGEMNDEKIYSVWVYDKLKEEEINKVEKLIQNKDESVSEAMEKVIGCKSTLSDSVNDIVENSKDILNENDFSDIYLIGSYARKKYEGEEFPEVEDLEFSSNSPNNCLKFGYLLSKRLGQKPYLNKKQKLLCFFYKGVKICCNAGNRYKIIDEFMQKNDIDQSSSLVHDLCNKDFTINARSYDLINNIVTTIFNNDVDSIKTIIDPNDAVSTNPMIILRAIYLSLLYNMKIDEKLEDSIDTYKDLLNEKFDDDILNFVKSKIESVNKKESLSLFKKYDLLKIFNGE